MYYCTILTVLSGGQTIKHDDMYVCRSNKSRINQAVHNHKSRQYIYMPGITPLHGVRGSSKLFGDASGEVGLLLTGKSTIPSIEKRFWYPTTMSSRFADVGLEPTGDRESHCEGEGDVALVEEMTEARRACEGPIFVGVVGIGMESVSGIAVIVDS